MPHDHDEVVALLSRLAGVDYRAAPADWDRALTALNLSIDYQPAVAQVLQVGRWRRAANPRAYIATAAVRLALRLGIDPRQGEILESPVWVARGAGESALVDSLAHYRDADGELVDVVQTASAGGPAPTPWARPSDDLRPTHAEGVLGIPSWLRSGRADIKWRLLVHILAPCPPAVATVLRLRAEGLSRHEIRQAARSPAHRTSLDAAWRWIESHAREIATVARCASERKAREAARTLFATQSTTCKQGGSRRARK